MQLDTRLPLAAAAQAPITFQPESRMQTLSRIAPGINAMRQMQAQQSEMEQMRQRSAALDRLREAAQGQDLNIFADAMIASGISGLMEKGAKLKQEILLEADFKKRYGGFAGQPMSGESIRDITFAGREGARMAGAIAPFVLTPAQEEVPVGQNIYNRRTGEFKTPPPREAPANALVPNAAPAAGGISADQRARILAQRGYEEVDGKVRFIPGGPADPEVQSRLAQARRAPGAPAAAPPTAGAEAPRPAGKPMSDSELARRRDAVAKEYRNAGTALQNLQETLNSANQVRTAPGLERATGFSGAYLPSFPGGAAAQAQTRLENLRGKITAMGKATAAMSGAIGSIANQEWKILADQIAVIDPVKGVGPMLEQIASLEQQARSAMERIKDAYEKQFSEDFERFPQFRELRMPAQGAGLVAPRTPPSSAPAARPRTGSAAPAPAPSGATARPSLDSIFGGR